MTDLVYQSGFGNEFSSEALPGALPVGQNSPQKAPYGLYPELLSGSAFTEPRDNNQRSWLYRIRPSVLQGGFSEIEAPDLKGAPLPEAEAPVSPQQYRWNPIKDPDSQVDFISGLKTMAVNGSIAQREGSAVHLYCMNTDMKNRYFYNADGDFLIVPQQGELLVLTEMGKLEVSPSEIVVIQRGIKFQVNPLVPGTVCKGYINENFGDHYRLPDLGPIGSNGLANPRDFLSPVAWYRHKVADSLVLAKFGGKLWQASIDHSPLDVVAWHGNYAPFKYDLRRFNTINSVSFDHPDPSIFTVLTSPSARPGVANIDFVIFPPRWMVAEHTFRPPYFHRNVMSEFMGLIHGVYDAKLGDDGFAPGGSSLHNCMSSHGPDGPTAQAAIDADLKPHYIDNTLAFMFESCLVFRPTRYALSESGLLQKNYHECWQSVPVLFDENKL